MYRCKLHLKNKEDWIQHLQNIKAKYPITTEEAIEKIFSFQFELEWISPSQS